MVVACRGFQAQWETKITEAYAIKFWMRIMWESGLRAPAMEADSLVVANALQGKKERLSDARTFVLDALSLALLFSFISFHHVKRKANFVAHDLA